jgi:hypothetical protein
MPSFKIYDPYQAVVRFDQPVAPEQLKMALELVADNTYRISFDRTAEFLNVLLMLPFNFVISLPNWLREKLKKKPDIIYINNFGAD